MMVIIIIIIIIIIINSHELLNKETYFLRFRGQTLRGKMSFL